MSCRRASVTAFELVARVDRHAFAGELNWCDVVVDEAARPAPFDTRLMPRAASDAAPSTNGANTLSSFMSIENDLFGGRRRPGPDASTTSGPLPTPTIVVDGASTTAAARPTLSSSNSAASLVGQDADAKALFGTRRQAAPPSVAVLTSTRSASNESVSSVKPSATLARARKLSVQSAGGGGDASDDDTQSVSGDANDLDQDGNAGD